MVLLPTAMLSMLNPRLEKTVDIRVKTPGSLCTVIDNVFFIKFSLNKKFKNLRNHVYIISLHKNIQNNHIILYN